MSATRMTLLTSSGMFVIPRSCWKLPKYHDGQIMMAIGTRDAAVAPIAAIPAISRAIGRADGAVRKAANAARMANADAPTISHPRPLGATSSSSWLMLPNPSPFQCACSPKLFKLNQGSAVTAMAVTAVMMTANPSARDCMDPTVKHGVEWPVVLLVLNVACGAKKHL